eukprot:scaffold1645_cov288-Pavlova_lutheri.AAC.5
MPVLPCHGCLSPLDGDGSDSCPLSLLSFDVLWMSIDPYQSIPRWWLGAMASPLDPRVGKGEFLLHRGGVLGSIHRLSVCPFRHPLVFPSSSIAGKAPPATSSLGSEMANLWSTALVWLASLAAASTASATALVEHRRKKRRRKWQVGPLRVELTSKDEGEAGGKVVQTGLQVLEEKCWKPLAGKRVGWITNHTGVLADLRHGVDVAQASGRVHIVAVFGPEHGFRGAAQAGAAEGFLRDARTGIPVHDIYQKSGKLLSDLFLQTDVEVLVIDLQDVGSRFYTYIWTMYDCLVAAASMERSPTVMVLDRPNPINGDVVQGPLLLSQHATFVGRKPICLRHGMTIGELARLFNGEFVPDEAGRGALLDVVTMRGWERSMEFKETGLPWVPPSPNIPTSESARAYVGFCLYEGTNCSEGRGTTLPFETVGAPWMDGGLTVALRGEIGGGVLKGVRFRECYFVPTFSKCAGCLCCGVQVYLEEDSDPLRVALATIITIKEMYPASFQWQQSESRFWVDCLAGTSQIREAIDAGASVDELASFWQDDLVWFTAMRAKYLLY